MLTNRLIANLRQMLYGGAATFSPGTVRGRRARAAAKGVFSTAARCAEGRENPPQATAGQPHTPFTVETSNALLFVAVASDVQIRGAHSTYCNIFVYGG